MPDRVISLLRHYVLFNFRDEVSRERESFTRWMERHVLGTPDHVAFLRSIDKTAATVGA